MPKRAVPQKIYKITLFKTFAYPSAVINEGNFLVDLHQKAVQDFLQGVVREKITFDSLDYKLEAEVPFKVRSSRDPINKTIRDNVSVDYLLTEIALHDTEQKYGKLDPKENKEAFRVIVTNTATGEEEDGTWTLEDDEDEEVTDTPTLGVIPPYLKPEVEAFLHERIDYYNNILRYKLL